MVAVKLTPTYNGKPIDKLNDLIKARMAETRETAKDAVVATAITALQSIRKATARFHGKAVKVNG